jgi:hypothetical protein
MPIPVSASPALTIAFSGETGERRARIEGPFSDDPPFQIALDTLSAFIGRLHPICLSIFAVGLDEGRFHIDIEAASGLDLIDWMTLRPPGPERVVSVWVVAEVARFLDEGPGYWLHHTRPEQILLETEGAVRVAFLEAHIPGLCMPLVDLCRPASEYLEFVAPDDAYLEDSPSSSVYQLGMLLAWLSSGARPLLSGDRVTMQYNVIRRSAPMSTLTLLPEGLAGIIDAATAPKRRDRTPTLRALREQLARILPDRESVRASLREALEGRGRGGEDRLRFCETRG